MADFDLAIIGGGINGTGLAREPGSVDAAADDGEVEVGHDCAELPADSPLARRMSGFTVSLKPV